LMCTYATAETLVSFPASEYDRMFEGMARATRFRV